MEESGWVFGRLRAGGALVGGCNPVGSVVGGVGRVDDVVGPAAAGAGEHDLGGALPGNAELRLDRGDHAGLVVGERHGVHGSMVAAGAEQVNLSAESSGMSPTEWVVSHNLHRRHLTPAQRAALALDLLPRLEEEARERQRLAVEQTNAKLGRDHETLPPISEEASGEATEKAAALVGVGRSTVATAKAIPLCRQVAARTGEVRSGRPAGACALRRPARASCIRPRRGVACMSYAPEDWPLKYGTIPPIGSAPAVGAGGPIAAPRPLA